MARIGNSLRDLSESDQPTYAPASPVTLDLGREGPMPMSYDPNQGRPAPPQPQSQGIQLMFAAGAILAGIGITAIFVAQPGPSRNVPPVAPAVNEAPAAPAPAPPPEPEPPAPADGIPLSPRIAANIPHPGCFVRPAGFTGSEAQCFWTIPGNEEGEPEYQCNTTRAGCEADRARFVEILGPVVTPCFARVGAICTDLVDGAGNRRCYANRRHCDQIRQAHDGTPCVQRSTF